jgi:ubiquinone/menaquinone biosynthesis C-methylase UbiE
MRTSPLRQTLKRVPVLAPLYRTARRQWWRLRDAGRARLSPKRRIAAAWDEATRTGSAGERARAWLSCDQVLEEYVYPQLGGVSWYGYLRRFRGPQPFDLSLTLCCGEGAAERNLIRHNLCRACEGIDISPQAVAHSREAARQAGLTNVTYRIADVERITLDPERYDLVLGWMGLHHLTRLRRVFGQVRRALRPEGVFVVNEYVGPARFQVPRAQVDLINSWLRQLPVDLRRTPSGTVRDTFVPPTVAEVVARDPSEAVSSDQILPELERQFVIAERVDYGGVLLHWLLADLTQNFDRANTEHCAWLQRLYEAEREALKSGAFPSDFTYLIVRKHETRKRCGAQRPAVARKKDG